MQSVFHGSVVLVSGLHSNPSLFNANILLSCSVSVAMRALVVELKPHQLLPPPAAHRAAAARATHSVTAPGDSHHGLTPRAQGGNVLF